MRKGKPPYIVVGGIAMPKDCLAGLVVPNRVGESRARGRILAIEMADAKLARALLVFMDNQQRGVSAV